MYKNQRIKLCVHISLSINRSNCLTAEKFIKFKMKPLKESYKWLVLCYICSSCKPLNRLKKFRNICVSIGFLLVQIASLIASFMFCVNNFHSDLPNSISACFQVAGLLAGTFIQVNGFFLRKKFNDTFNAFQIFYDLSKYSNVYKK